MKQEAPTSISRGSSLIEEGITNVGTYIFTGLTNLKYIYLPQSLDFAKQTDKEIYLKIQDGAEIHGYYDGTPITIYVNGQNTGYMQILRYLNGSEDVEFLEGCITIEW